MTAHERERLSAWLDGELAPAARTEVEAHLAACEECGALLANLAGVDEIARELPAEAPTGYLEALPGRVRVRIERTTHARPAALQARWRMPVWTWAAAAVVLLAVVTPLTLERLDRSGTPARQNALVQAPKEAPPVSALSDGPERRDETGPADREPAPEARARPEPGLRRENHTREPQRAFAAAPPSPEPTLGAAASSGAPARARGRGGAPPAGAPSSPESRARERRTDAPASPPQAPVFAEGEALGEALTATPAPRREVEKDDVMTRDAAPEAHPAAVAARMKGRTAAARAMDVQGCLDVAEKKAHAEDARVFARLSSEAPSRATAWRERRAEWRQFVSAYPESHCVDEARVRVIEAGLEAWRAGRDPDDLARARADADAYLDRDDARQKKRVLHALDAAQGR